MTHNDIKKNFMIEYDKANVTSSYPSLTDEEIATILNKSYLALIAQKVTGNNPRQVPFEADVKAISDLQELIITSSMTNPSAGPVENSVMYTLPQNFLYYISGIADLTVGNATVVLISHENALKFKLTISNRPWIKNAVAYVEDNKIILLYDNYAVEDMSVREPGDFKITYIKEPIKFTSAFSGTFELNDSMAEELISLSVLMALENVESQRLQSKAQMRGLEA